MRPPTWNARRQAPLLDGRLDVGKDKMRTSMKLLPVLARRSVGEGGSFLPGEAQRSRVDVGMTSIQSISPIPNSARNLL